MVGDTGCGGVFYCDGGALLDWDFGTMNFLARGRMSQNKTAGFSISCVRTIRVHQSAFDGHCFVCFGWLRVLCNVRPIQTAVHE